MRGPPSANSHRSIGNATAAITVAATADFATVIERCDPPMPARWRRRSTSSRAPFVNAAIEVFDATAESHRTHRSGSGVRLSTIDAVDDDRYRAATDRVEDRR